MLLKTVHSVVRDGQQEDARVILSVPRESLGANETTESELSRREMEILLLAACGAPNKRIGEKLHISETTVKRHLSNVYAKLGVGSRSQAASKAISEGWISTWDISRAD